MYSVSNKATRVLCEKYLSSQLIDIESLFTIDELEYHLWRGMQRWLISTPTGSGKTTWIIDFLSKKCKLFKKSILILSNRIMLREQILKMIENKGQFNCINYQALLETKNLDILKDYDIIICDEAHIFFNDYKFNPDTERYFNLIKDIRASLIFLTATPEDLIKYFDEIKYRYILKTKNVINNSIRKVTLIDYKNDLVNHLNKSKDKFLILNNNNKENIEIKNKVLDCKMIMSKSNEKYQSHNSLEEISNIIEKRKFDSRVLLCTSVSDNGISISDKDLFNVGINSLDPVQLNQFLGRVRIENKKMLDLILPKLPSNNILASRTIENNDILEQLDLFDRFGISSIKDEEFKKYFKQNKETKEWYYNGFMRRQIAKELNILKMLKENHTKEFYYDWIFKVLNIGNNFEIVDDDSIFKETILKFANKKLFKEDQEKLQEKIREYLINSKISDKYETLGINKLKKFLNNFDFTISSIKEQNKKHINYSKMYWNIQ